MMNPLSLNVGASQNASEPGSSQHRLPNPDFSRSRHRLSRLSKAAPNIAPAQARPWLSSSRLIQGGLLAIATLLLGWAPSLGQDGGLSFDSRAMAQSKKPVSAEQIAKFVRSAMAMEPKRKQAVQEIQAIMGQVPTIRCDNRESFNELDPAVRGVAINYCNESKRIVESNELSVERFNEILLEQRSNKALRERIQGEICRLEPTLCR